MTKDFASLTDLEVRGFGAFGVDADGAFGVDSDAHAVPKPVDDELST